MAISKIDVSNMLDETLPVANGGTGVTTAADLANAGNMVLIKTQTVSSAVSSVEFKNGVDDVVFDNTYKFYKVIFRDVFGSTNETEHNFRVSSDGGSTYRSTGYLTTLWRSYWNGTTNGSNQNYYSNRIKLLNMHVKTALSTGSHNGEMTFWNPSETGKDAIISVISAGFDGDYSINAIGHSSINANGDIDAIKFYMSSGNISGGSYTLYGIKD